MADLVGGVLGRIGGFTGDGGTDVGDSVKAELDLIKAKTDTISGGSPVATASATTTGVIVQEYAGAGNPDLVDIAIDEVSNNTLSAWVTVDSTMSADSWIAGISVCLSSGCAVANGYKIQIGTGAPASEAVKITFSFYDVWISSVGVRPTYFFTLPIPIKVASGVRIAARASKSASGSGAVVIKVGVCSYQSLETS
jgi:hypothetical protein